MYKLPSLLQFARCRPWRSYGLALLLAFFGVIDRLPADTWELSDGGQLRGELLNPDERPRRTYVIRLGTGGVLTLDSRQVRRVVRESDAETEYERRSVITPDTVDGHWELASWCREQRLNEYRKHHLARIIELDPSHAEARRLLGYRQFDGRWMTRDEWMASKGMVFFEGDYRTRQEIELRKRSTNAKQQDADWRGQLRRWRQWLSGRRPERVDEAVRKFRSLDDPAAAPQLVKMLADEKQYEVKLLLIEVLSQLPSSQAVDALVNTSLRDASEELREESLDRLIRQRPPGLVGHYISALRDKNNTIVNRAAYALKTINAPAAISPLIDALVTRHRFKVVTGDSGQTSATFSPQGGGFSFGNSGPRFINRDLKNPEVLSALIAVSGGENFEYDEAAWSRWFAAQHKSQRLDARRDP